MVISSLQSARKVLVRLLAEVLSNPLVGSSNNKIDGLVSSSVPMLQRFFSPPDICSDELELVMLQLVR